MAVMQAHNNEDTQIVFNPRIKTVHGRITWRKCNQETNRPYSEQRHDRYGSEAVRDRLTVFPMASAVKS